MGSSASKPARAAAGAASRRQYPQQPAPPLTSAPNPPPPPKQPPPSQGPKYHSKEQPSNVKSDGTHPATPTSNMMRLTKPSNRPRRPRSRLRRLPPQTRPRNTSAHPLPLQHLHPTPNRSRAWPRHAQSNGLPAIIQPGAPRSLGPPAHHESGRARE